MSASSVVSAPAKPTLRLMDETFDSTNRGGYGLYLVVRADGGVRVGVADTVRNKFVVLEDYDALEVSGEVAAGPTAALRALVSHHSWLGTRGWRHVRVAVQHPRCTLVPGALFRSADAAALLALHCDVDLAHERVLWHDHTTSDITAVFAAEAALPDWLAATYGAGATHVLHHVSALLEGLLHQPDPGTPAVVGLHVSAGLLTVAVVRQRRLEFCNVFSFGTAEDLLYYTILVLQELQLSPEHIPVTVWGDVTHDSAILSLLQRYLGAVRLGARPPDLLYSYRFDPSFPHRYFELFALHLCE